MPTDRTTGKGHGPGGLILVDILAIVAVLAMLLAAVAPVASRAKELARRRLCSLNLKSIGTASKIYANDTGDEVWPMPAFRARVDTNDPNIDYVHDEGPVGLPNLDAGEVGYARHLPSFSQTPPQPDAGSTAVSVTRAFWMLVRSGDLTVEQFICPSSGDQPDPTGSVELYYDFTQYTNVSYGYMVPFGPRDTRPRESSDARQIFAADKSPFYSKTSVEFIDSQGDPIEVDDTPRAWQPFNSPNHGGVTRGEGQNCLFADGHVSFQRRPTAGIQSDNIYTVITNDWNASGFNRSHGDTVHQSLFLHPFPGQGAFGGQFSQYSSTDSLLYP